jgi:hypothetical protein
MAVQRAATLETRLATTTKMLAADNYCGRDEILPAFST